MGLFGPNVAEEKKKLEAERQKKAAEQKRLAEIAVENHKNTGNAQFHTQTKKMTDSKEKEIEQMRAETKEQLKETRDSAYLKKLELANEGDKEKVQVLLEQEAKRKALEKEHQDRARDEQRRTDQIKKDQDATSGQIDAMKKQNMEEGLKETRKTEDFRDRLTEEQKQLNEKHQRAVLESQLEDKQVRLQTEKELNDKSEENYQKKIELTLTNMDETMNQHRRFLAIAAATSKENDLKAVNTEIASLQEMAGIILKYANEATEPIDVKMEDALKIVALTKLDSTDAKLTELLQDFVTLDRRILKISDKETRQNLVDDLKKVKKRISSVKTTMTELKRELKRPTGEIDLKIRNKFIKEIKKIVDGVNCLGQVETNHEAVTIAIGGNAVPGSSQEAIKYDE